MYKPINSISKRTKQLIDTFKAEILNNKQIK